ncbi:hypothetical protein AYK26_05420 [Euryarchaeota archaeon SM23-78]|nr:MAG: hypothetical protein AYK26_05420 [Euryarchaeota archaeon SM23-78]MBW3001041.1 lytic transglycosylase domain-containing protein [Candidatus Woesearchaeota archaeon]
MHKAYTVKIGIKQKPLIPRRKREIKSLKTKKSSEPRKPLHKIIDAKQYKINQFVGPVIYGTLVAGVGIKGLDYIIDKISLIKESTPVVGSTEGKIVLATLSGVLLYEIGKDVLLGTKKSRIPIINKIKYDGIWRIGNRKNKELYKKDKKKQIGRARKTLGYLKNLSLAGLMSAVIVTGAGKNTSENLRFNLSEVLYQPKGITQLDQKQADTLENILEYNLGTATDSKIKQAMIEAELYRMTNTRANRRSAWTKKRRVKKYEPIIRKWVEHFGLLPNTSEGVKLVEGLIFQESGGNRYAKSNKDAKGLMQLMWTTAKDYKVEDIYDPNQNIRGGVNKLKDLLIQCKGNIGLALTLYNCRKDAVEWAIAKSGSDDPFVFVHWLQKEPREYAVKVLAAATYMVNGDEPTKTQSTGKGDSGNFHYIRTNSTGEEVFSYIVQKGDSASEIADLFNIKDEEKDEYKPVTYKDVVYGDGKFVGNTITPGDDVCVLASKK